MNRSESGRAMKLIGIVLIVFAALVATHEGEFWPFSIYPMFSQAGNPWTRAMVLDVTDIPDDEIWQQRPLSEKRGDPLPVRSVGVDQIDYSNFISKTDNWTQSRREALLEMFGRENIGNSRWMAVKVRGEPVGDDSVAVTVKPWLLMTRDGVEENPLLDDSDYFKGGDH